MLTGPLSAEISWIDPRTSQIQIHEALERQEVNKWGEGYHDNLDQSS